MSHFSVSSSLALFQSVLTDSDATCSSTSSSSAINVSSNSLSLSPTNDRDNRLAKQSIDNHYKEQLQKEITEEGEELLDLLGHLDQGFIELETELIEDEDVTKQNQENRYYDRDYSTPHIRTEDDQHHIERREEVDEEGEELQQENHHHIPRDIQLLTSNLPKPCAFFMEGACRRSDCKFSHDLSRILCKYWIEGFCFKGEWCPFSHKFDPMETYGTEFCEDGDLSLSKKDPTFVIESEADFPSLPLDSPKNPVQQSAKASALTKTTKSQILTSNPSVVFKSNKKKKKRKRD